MKKHLNFLCFLSVLFLYGCGFEPILSSKNINKSYVISIDEVNFKNYNELNNLFLRKFRYYQKDDEDLKKFNITLDVNKTKRIVSKNKKGDPETFNMEVIADIIILNRDKSEILHSQTFRRNENYNNLSNKFDLKQEENIIENNIIDQIVDEILNTLFSMQ